MADPWDSRREYAVGERVEVWGISFTCVDPRDPTKGRVFAIEFHDERRWQADGYPVGWMPAPSVDRRDA